MITTRSSLASLGSISPSPPSTQAPSTAHARPTSLRPRWCLLAADRWLPSETPSDRASLPPLSALGRVFDCSQVREVSEGAVDIGGFPARAHADLFAATPFTAPLIEDNYYLYAAQRIGIDGDRGGLGSISIDGD